MEINFTAIIISSLFTIVTYLGIPLIIAKISKKELTPKRVKKIVIINGVCWWIFFRILNPGSAGAAAWVWSGIAYAILNHKCKKENSEENLQEKRVEIAEKESPEEKVENVVDTSMDSNTYGNPQDLLFCPVCCAQLLSDSIFCSRCGNKVQAKREPPPRKKKRVPKVILISIFSIFSILAIIIAIVCYFKVFIPKNTYDKAEDLFANAEYSEAYEIFISLGKYKDSVKKSKDCLYIQATTLRNEKKWEEANAIFEQIKGYKSRLHLWNPPVLPRDTRT